MAAWHFKFSLVPANGLRKEGLGVGDVLVEYRSLASQEKSLDADLSDDEVDHWKGFDTNAIGHVFAGFLPSRDSWGAEAVMLGYEEGDRVEIWPDDVVCQIDVRNFSLANSRAIIEVAHAFDCLLMLHGEGRVVESKLEVFLKEIEGSPAYAFCVDPRKFLAERSWRSSRLEPELLPVDSCSSQ